MSRLRCLWENEGGSVEIYSRTKRISAPHIPWRLFVDDEDCNDDHIEHVEVSNNTNDDHIQYVQVSNDTNDEQSDEELSALLAEISKST